MAQYDTLRLNPFPTPPGRGRPSFLPTAFFLLPSLPAGPLKLTWLLILHTAYISYPAPLSRAPPAWSDGQLSSTVVTSTSKGLDGCSGKRCLCSEHLPRIHHGGRKKAGWWLVTADQERIKRHTVPNCILGASGDCCREKMAELRNTASKLETFKDDFESPVLQAK